MPRDLFDVADVANAIETARREVRYFVTDYPVDTLIARYKKDSPAEGDIYVPDYQRMMQWDDTRKSYFIESLILRIPIPPVFLYEVDGKLEIVDGSQRIRTMVEFRNNGFGLSGLEKLDVLNGFKFSDLPPSTAKRLLNTPIRTFILEQGTDESTRVELFRRINTSSKALTEAEIRKGAYRGPFLDLVIDCADRLPFKRLAPGEGTRGNKNSQSERQELVTRFFIYSDFMDEFTHDVRRFLDAKFKFYNQNLSPEEISEKSREFDRVMEFIDRHMPRAFFRTETAKQVPRVRFEAVSVGTAFALRRGVPLQTEDLSWLYGPDFIQLVRTDASNSGPKLRARIGYVRDRLLGVP
jgi:hypothetical protein